MPKSEVWGVASHYPELRLTRPGRRLVRVCTGVSCRVRGGRELLAACERTLGVRAGQTTADGAVTLEELDCAFACSVAPVVEVDHAYRGRAAPGDVDSLLSSPPRAGHAAEPIGTTFPTVSGSPAERVAALVSEAGQRRASARIAVGVGACSMAVGADDTLERLRDEVASRKLPFAVVAAGCNGMCWAAPTVTVARDGQPPLVAGPVSAADVPRLLDALAGDAREAPAANAARSMASSSRCGSPSIRWRSLKMPGSPSSPFTTMYFGVPGAARHAAHFTAVWK